MYNYSLNFYLFTDVNQAFHIAARKILIKDDVIDKFSFALPGKSELKDAEMKEKILKEFGAKGKLYLKNPVILLKDVIT